MFDSRPQAPALEVRTHAGETGICVIWHLRFPAGVLPSEARALVELVHDTLTTALRLDGWVS